MVSELGGDEIPGVGWAAGIERLESLIFNSSFISLPVILIPTEKIYELCLTISNNLYYENKNQILNHFNLKIAEVF